ncbi:hypothetical protein AKJ09_03323 [Labilithrix luteola]|uniref:Uncharacterized protein n=1 Tax=Labilithrix luteola TaxID=1391654 RepID=A0A0K1PU53_9BACT|nr:hypothetical protein AKJ09_03323 [Labilithrix luteola]
MLAPSIALAPGCSSSDEASSSSPTTSFDLEAKFDAEGAFFDFPYPSDLRLTAEGTPDVSAFPNPGVAILDGLKKGAMDRKGFPVVPAGYFRFNAQLAARDPEVLVQGGAKAPILLVDVDPASPERGKTFPVVAATPNADPYVPDYLLAVAARPGIVLTPNRKYAFVVTRAVGLQAGGEPKTPDALAALARGETPKTANGDKLSALYAPLWETLDKIGVARTDVANATVFTTGDVVAETAALGDKVLAQYTPALTDLALEADPANKLPELCHVRAKIVLPQFQKGTPIYSTEGLFEMGADGLPKKQRDESVPVSIAIPRTPMPAGGYPLVIYFHGSGGVSRQVIDGGDDADPGDRYPGPNLAKRGIASAGAALPISPERVPGASDIDYLNINNLIAMRDTFRQGILESRLVLAALEKLSIPPSMLEGCAGPTLPAGETAYHFTDKPHAQGQSMGGMYTNLVSAVEPRIKLSVPTGAGGFWVYFILKTSTVPGAAGLVALLMKTPEQLTFVHPALHIAETALEAIDPMVSAIRVARRPLPGHPARPIYEPAGLNDSYFPTPVYDAMDLSYGHPRVGDEIWPTMRDAQKLVGLDTPLSYPVKANLTSENGQTYTGAIVQYDPGPGNDGHAIYRQKPVVQHQYACFHSTFLETGTATIVAPVDDRDAPCNP